MQATIAGRVFIGVSPAAPQAGEARQLKIRVFTGVSPAAPQAGEARQLKTSVFTGVSPAALQAGEASLRAGGDSAAGVAGMAGAQAWEIT